MIKEAREWGNSAGIRVPKEWLGMKVQISPMAPLSMEEIQKEVINMVNNYLVDIEGVYLAGSYARMEPISTSDIDILVISDKMIKIPKKEPYDIYVISRDRLEKTIRYNPLLVMSMIREAKPIINKALLEDLKKIELKFSYFREHLESTKRALDIIDGLLEGYDNKDVATSSLIYPIVLRLRGLYLVEGLLKNKLYKTSKVKNDIEKQGIKKERVERIYRIYQVKRDTTKSLSSNIAIGEIKKIYDLALKKYQEVSRWLKEK